MGGPYAMLWMASRKKQQQWPGPSTSSARALAGSFQCAAKKTVDQCLKHILHIQTSATYTLRHM